MPFNSIFSWFIKKRIHQIDLFKKYPFEVQEELLSNLIKQSQHTEWGKSYDYANIGSYAEFNKAVPLTDYTILKPFVDRLLKNEQNLLWSSDIKWFASHQEL